MNRSIKTDELIRLFELSIMTREDIRHELGIISRGEAQQVIGGDYDPTVADVLLGQDGRSLNEPAWLASNLDSGAHSAEDVYGSTMRNEWQPDLVLERVSTVQVTHEDNSTYSVVLPNRGSVTVRFQR